MGLCSTMVSSFVVVFSSCTKRFQVQFCSQLNIADKAAGVRKTRGKLKGHPRSLVTYDTLVKFFLELALRIYINFVKLMLSF